MYGIGIVARLAQVSVRTLRHYDELGLLKPARADPVTGYRYYTPGQVLRLHRILVLRDLGVPLSQIGQLLDDDVSVEQLRGILRLRQAEARVRVAAQSDQLRRVEIRLAPTGWPRSGCPRSNVRRRPSCAGRRTSSPAPSARSRSGSARPASGPRRGSGSCTSTATARATPG
jgi:DNA-binding transcriptional MerR regulator